MSYERLMGYPTTDRPMGNFIEAAGVSATTGNSTADAVIKYGFWVGLGWFVYRSYRVLRYDDPFFVPRYKLPPAWEANPRLTKEERGFLLEEIRSQHERGATVKEIAEILGIKRARVWSCLSEMGLTPHKPSFKSDEDDERWKEFAFFAVSSPGEKVADLAKDFGITNTTAYKWLSKAGVNITAPGKISKRQPGILGGIIGTKEGQRKKPTGYQQLVIRVLEVYEPGMNVAALAEEFNVSYHTMRNLLIKEGVYKPIPPLTLQKSQSIKRGLRQYYKKRRSPSRRNPDSSDAEHRNKLRAYGIADPPEDFVITRVRYVMGDGDWYILVKDQDWYWYDKRDESWKFLPWGPFENQKKENLTIQCAWGGRVWRDGKWRDEYVRQDAFVTHGMCDDCVSVFESELDDLEEEDSYPQKNTEVLL